MAEKNLDTLYFSNLLCQHTKPQRFLLIAFNISFKSNASLLVRLNVNINRLETKNQIHYTSYIYVLSLVLFLVKVWQCMSLFKSDHLVPVKPDK